MLDKNDLKAIGDLIDKRASATDKRLTKLRNNIDNKITKALSDFFEDVLEPYFERLEKRHDSHDNNFDTVFRKFDEIDDHLVNHEKRIKKLETTLNP